MQTRILRVSGALSAATIVRNPNMTLGAKMTYRIIPAEVVSLHISFVFEWDVPLDHKDS